MDLKRYLPILQWAPSYGRDQATSDLVAAVIVTVMLIPSPWRTLCWRASRRRSGCTPVSCHW